MKLFEAINRVAWIALVVSFLVKKEETRKLFQIAVLLLLIVDFYLEVIGV